MGSVPDNPKIYHIVHVDRLPSIIHYGWLYSDKVVVEHGLAGTNIGMAGIKARRMQNELASHPGLHVGECVPFYFCPRSVMLYMIHRGNPELAYAGGQSNIIHLEADLHESIRWATTNNLRWAFTLSNAGAYYFEDRADARALGEINWEAVRHDGWGYRGADSSLKEGKQAEFLVEQQFPWELFSGIGMMTIPSLANKINGILQDAKYKPRLEYKPGWYY